MAYPLHHMSDAPTVPAQIRATLSQLEANVAAALPGKPSVVRLCLVALMARGHVLLEDVPGVGKTTLAKALARALGLGHIRVQFTNDFLPSDLLGVSVYSTQTSEFHVRRGPVFTNILLADELNRASPRAQSALLEAMSEGSVSLDGQTLALPDPFFVIATQNPTESAGVFPLPESQLDRFLMRLTVGYPSAEVETNLLRNDPKWLAPPAAMDPTALAEILELAPRIMMGQACAEYAYSLIDRTRNDKEIGVGASPRASIALARAARAYALFEGRGYVTPEDVREVALPVLGHRIKPAASRLLAGDARQSAEAIVRRIIDTVPLPV